MILQIINYLLSLSNRNIHDLVTELGSQQTPNSTVNAVVSSIHSLLSTIFLYIRANFLPSDINVYNRFIEYQNEILRTVKGLSTTYMRRKAAFDKVPKPKEIILGERIERQFDKKLQTYIESPKLDKFMYISVIDNLKYLCSRLNFQKQLLRENLSKQLYKKK